MQSAKTTQRLCLILLLSALFTCYGIHPFDCPSVTNVSVSATHGFCAKYEWHALVSTYLKPFHMNGISKEDVDNAETHCSTLFDGIGGWRVVINDSNMYMKPIAKMTLDSVHTQSMLMLLSKLLVYKIGPLNVDMVVHKNDWAATKFGQRIPIFGWAKSRNDDDIPLPNLHSLGRDMNHVLQDVQRSFVAWENKKPIAYFRGSTTGRKPIDKENWNNFTRAKLVGMCHSMRDICDADFHQIVQAKPEAEALLRAEYGVASRQVPLSAQFRYKYLILPDGNGPASRSLPYFHSGSVILKQRSEVGEFFFDIMVPGVHYVELAPDFSDLREKVLWLREHDAEARAIAQAAQERARHYITDASITCYMHELLSRYQSLMRFTPHITDEMRQFDIQNQKQLPRSLQAYYRFCPT